MSHSLVLGNEANAPQNDVRAVSGAGGSWARVEAAISMETPATGTHNTPAALYERVVREARVTYGGTLGDENAEAAARDAVDEFLVRKAARVTTFVPVLALRRLRETVGARSQVGD